MIKKAVQHIPKYSQTLIRAFTAPLMLYFIGAGNTIMFLSAWLFFHIEKTINPEVSTYWDALWWALCTVSTVGYGDIHPMTGAGRVIAAFLIIAGVMFYLGSMAVMVTFVTTHTAKKS